MKQWKRLAALSSAIVMAAATLTYFPSDTLQNIRWEISASAETTTEPQVWIEDNLTWTLDADGTLTISGAGAMKDYDYNNNQSPVYMNSSVKKVVIEDGVTSIGNWAFYKCTSLTTITIPDSVTSIGEAAFRGCSSLTSITIPDSVTSIGDAAFSHCSNLKSITIPDSITSIGKYAFCNCSSLTSITIPNSVTSIGESALAGCVNLTSITIPKSVTSIGSGVFDGCNNLTVYLESGSTLTSNDLGVNESKIGSYWVEDNLTWKLDADGTLTISGTGAMKDYDYNNNPSPANQKKGSVKKVVIKDGVTSIGKYAFCNCSNLKSITILDSVTSIGDFAFSDCSSLTSITIPDSVTSIGDFAFSGCSSLTSITIPDSVTSIGDDAFSYCRSLTSITIPDSVTSIGNDVFYGCSSLQIISLSCKSTLKKSDFGGQADLVSYTNQHTLTKTEAKAATCTEDGNKEYWTCEHCGKYFLSDDTNPETAKAVELSETILPAIQHKNAELRNASEPTETSPGYSGDLYCPDCDKVVEKGYTYWNEGNLTWKLYADGTLNISGTGAMKDYNATDNLSPAYNNSKVKKIVIEDGVTSIGDIAFSYCRSLTSITIPDSVTSIEFAAFNNCSSLTSITIPDSVTNIEDCAFEWCSSLSNITLPNNITSIGTGVFHGCSSLTSITIPDGVTSIGNNAFDSCSSLTSITIPDSVTSIGEAAFFDCTSLETISLSCKSTLKRSDFGKQADLVSYTSHTLKKTEAKAATYAENGNKAYWTCEHCGKYFLSDDTNPETATAVELSETVIPALVQVATTTTPIKCVYGQDMNKIDLRDYVKNTDVVGEVAVKVATGSTLPDGIKLDGSKLSGKPAKAYEDSKEVTFTFTAENGSTENLTLLFLVAKAEPTVEVAVSGDSHTEGDLVSELKLILSENSTKGVVKLVSEIKALVAGKNTFTWEFMPEDENNYHTVTGTVVVNAQTTTTTTTTTKATTTTTKATTTTKPNKTTTTNATTTTKPSKTTTTKVTTTTKPNKTTTTKATTTTKPSKTTTTKVTTTTKPSKTTTTKVTTTTKPSKTTTTKVTTTTKPSKTTTTKVTTTTKPSKTTTTNATTTTKPSKTTTTNATTTNTAIPSYGDVNLDGKVDIVDAIFLNKYLATLIQFSDAQVANADCCQDGVLNDQDTTALMQFIILLIDDLPVQPTEK